MTAKKKTPAKRPAAKPTEATPKAKAKPALVRNINLDGVWYGPYYGNADQYPDDHAHIRPSLFEDR